MQEQLDAHERRLAVLEGQMTDVRLDMEEIRSDLKTNTDTTAAIKKDTGDLVVLLKGGKVMGLVAVWTAGLYAAWAQLKGLFK